jgi:PAS domain S-box-containing protein
MRQKELPALDSVLRRLVLIRLFLPLVALSVIVITGVGYLSIQTLESQQQLRAQFIAQNIDDYLNEAARSLNAVARVADATPSKNVAFMQATLKANSYFDTLSYVDASGKIKYMVPADSHYLGLDVTSLPYFQQLKEKNDISISRPFISIRTGRPTVYLVRQLSEEGWAVGELSLGSLQDEITRRGIGSDVVFIMDKSGMLLAHPNADLVKQQTNQSYLEIFRRGLKEDAAMAYKYSGTMVVGIATRVERTGWVVVDQVPVSVALGPYAWALGLALLGSLAIWLLLMWSLRNQLEGQVSIPLSQLSRGTNALANGDFSQGKALTAVPGAFSELNELAADFQHMSDALEARQAQLQESEELNRLTLSNIVDAVFVTDDAGSFIYICPNVDIIFGYSVQEVQDIGNIEHLLGKELFSPDDLKTSQRLTNIEREIGDKFGRTHTLIINVVRVDIKGGTHLYTCHDITEIKKAEEALRNSEARQRQRLEALVEERTHELLGARDAAESANRAKSIFLANMSHELRTPLNAILGFAQLMNRDESIPDHAKQNLAIINRSGEHLLSMINDVLDLSKIEAGKAELKEEPFDLIQTIKDIGEMIRARAQEKRLEVIVDLDPDIEQFIKADLGKIRQILINLLGNAVKFTDEGGIALRARTVSLTDDTARALLEIEVEDTGPGMPEDRLEAIFTPFTQVGTTKSSLMGTGLGLTISQSYARMMDGNISVESDEGKGSVFKLQLSIEIIDQEMVPRTEMQQLAVIGVEEGESDYRILIVEDNYENAILLKTLLDQAGLSAKIARDGKEGVETAEAWRPHFIWMDMKMPVMDGYEATRFIRSQSWGKEIVIAAFTASAFSDQENAIAEAGCNCLVRKPFRSQEIFDAMSKHLGIRFKYSEMRDEKSAGTYQTKKTERPSISELKSLPENVVENILKAAVELDKHSILAIADEFAQTNPNLSAYLKNQVLSYNFEDIEMLFSPTTDKKAS